jgi:hypothetical protein
MKDRKHQAPPKPTCQPTATAWRPHRPRLSPSHTGRKRRFSVGLVLKDTPLRVHSAPPQHVRLRPHPSRWPAGLVPTAQATPVRSASPVLRTGRRTGGRTTARSAITLPHVGHATPSTLKTRHNSTLHGVQREVPMPAFVCRSPTPGGGAGRLRGRGRTARCHRCQLLGGQLKRRPPVRPRSREVQAHPVTR